MKNLAIVIVLIGCFFSQVYAGTVEDPNSQGDLFEMSLEELMEVPVVVSSSRQENKINKASVPISIVTAEDIHYSGQTNIPEMLQFVPGVDVVKFNRHLYGVGVHGLHETLSNRVVALVDGRAANNPMFGGPEFNLLPVFLEDIERIEVVRGPGGAAWGANAFTGAINIITKDPQDTQGFFGSTTVTEFGDTFNHLRWGKAKGDWAWRFSAGYEGLEDSDDAGAGKYSSVNPSLNPFIGYNNYVARDFSRSWKFDSQGVYRPSDDIKISVGAGYSHTITGSYELSGYYPLDENNRHEMLRLFTKIEREFDDGSSGHVQWFGNFLNYNLPVAGHYDSKEYDIEAQYNFAPVAGHHFSLGGNFRWNDIYGAGIQAPLGQYYTFSKIPYHERTAGVFGIDRWDVSDQLTLETQLRGDWYSEVTTDWSGRFAALYDLDGTDEHILRFSVAKAFRSPLAAVRDLESKTVPIGGFYQVNNYPPPSDLRNEQTWSFEAGYSGQLTDRLSVSVNGFYQRMSDLIGYQALTPGPTLGMDNVPANIDGADTYGAEVELAYKDEHKKISAWYAYEHFELDRSYQPIRAFQPPTFKFGLNGRWFLSNDWVFNANYRFNDETKRNPFVGTSGDASMADIDCYNLLDLALSKKFANGKGEVMVGVSDVFNRMNEPIFETTTNANHKTPGRMFFGRVQFYF